MVIELSKYMLVRSNIAELVIFITTTAYHAPSPVSILNAKKLHVFESNQVCSVHVLQNGS